MFLLIRLVQLLFGLYSIAIIARTFLSWVQVDPYHPYYSFARFLYRITEPILAPLRKRIPPVGMLDISPIVALIILLILQWIIVTLLYSFAI
jgi:YggT family protein